MIINFLNYLRTILSSLQEMYDINKRVTLAYIIFTIIGKTYMSFFGYSYFNINTYSWEYQLKDFMN